MILFKTVDLQINFLWYITGYRVFASFYIEYVHIICLVYYIHRYACQTNDDEDFRINLKDTVNSALI